MNTSAQINALKNYRQRLSQRGMGRFEVKGLIADRPLIRAIAARLAEDNSEEVRNLRTSLCRSISPEPASTGRILAALRRSPLVGADLDIARDDSTGRVIDL
jgi:hypothetical protein